jgi:hypothetical protein
MIRTGAQYRDSIRDGRRVYIGGERVKDVTTHPMFKPLVDIRARFACALSSASCCVWCRCCSGAGSVASTTPARRCATTSA